MLVKDVYVPEKPIASGIFPNLSEEPTNGFREDTTENLMMTYIFDRFEECKEWCDLNPEYRVSRRVYCDE